MGCVDTMQVKANSLMLALTMSALLVVRADGAGSCKAFTCSVRKQAEDSCQCNPHCRVHKDCCSDYEAICPNTTDPSLLRKAAAAPTDSSTVRVSVNDMNLRVARNHTNGEHNEEDHTKGRRSTKQPPVKRPDKQHRVSSDLVSSDANGHRRLLLSLASNRSGRVSSAARLRARLRARSDANATNVFVFGLESSGTRFVSRAIASAIKPTNWDGEKPPCWHDSRWKIHHISLPWGGQCNDKTASSKFTTVSPDMCAVRGYPRRNTRWFADITSILRSNPRHRAVIIERNAEFSYLSSFKQHCPFPNASKAERDYGRALIRGALAAVPGQIVLVHYETLLWYGQHEWMRIFEHIGLGGNHHSLPEFRDGNAEWVRKYNTALAGPGGGQHSGDRFSRRKSSPLPPFSLPASPRKRMSSVRCILFKVSIKE